MDNSRDKNYVKKIIEEYNLFLEEWGHSDNWNQSQFKTLEDMIFEATRIQVNANTLRRFFQQRTGNPQTATKEALCKFLGYSSYTDFVLKKTETEKKEGKEKTEPSIEEVAKGVKRNQNHIYLITLLIGLISVYFLYEFILKDWYNEYQISSIRFSTVKTKGETPFTVSFSYTIPSKLFNDISIVYEEANGDITEKKLKKEVNFVNATYIYEGEAYCHLKYKDEIIRTIPVTILRPGWSVHVREEKKHFFRTFPISDAYGSGTHLSLPLEKIPEEARASHLFVSYVFYREDLIDGDNLIFEARVRNSMEEHTIPLSDIIMYIRSDTHEHGFAMNEGGHAYIKFISSENSIKGDEYDLSGFSFDSSMWHIMKIKVVDKQTTFFVDEEEILNMSYKESLEMANELILRFKGCGIIDYVKVSKLDGEIVYQENFDHISP